MNLIKIVDTASRNDSIGVRWLIGEFENGFYAFIPPCRVGNGTGIKSYKAFKVEQGVNAVGKIRWNRIKYKNKEI